MVTEAATVSDTLRRTTNLRAALVVFTAALVMFTTNGFIFVGLTAFDRLLLDRLGISVGALKTRDAVTLITAAILSPLSGYMLDRFGVRPILAAGMIFIAVGMFAYGSVTSIGEIYLIHVLFGCCLVMAGLFVCIILITSVTSRHRGLAVGVVLAGASLGSALAPRLNLLLEAAYGWQHALRGSAILALALVPVILLVVPGRRLPAPVRGSTPATSGLSYPAALRTRNFWLLSSTAMVTFFAQLGILTNLVLFSEKQLHLPVIAASQAIFVLSISALLFQLCAGTLIDRVGTKPVHLFSILLMGAGIGALALCPPAYRLPIVACIGIGWGGNYVSIQVTTSKLFFGNSMGRILGTINVIEAAGAGLGPMGVGRLYDVTHNYAVPFTLVSAAVLLMSIAVMLIVAPKR